MAFVGPSGAGNSSIFALLLRFYDPQEVSIIIDGNEIKDNICYSNNVASETEFVKVLRQANMYEFISNLPDGYNAVVGEKGCPFSGGQKQRIGIAKTLRKKPDILLLDEATNALEAKSEKAFMSALETTEKLWWPTIQNFTNEVAHRFYTIINSDTT